MHSGAELTMIERLVEQLRVAQDYIAELLEEREARDLQDKADGAFHDYCTERDSE